MPFPLAKVLPPPIYRPGGCGQLGQLGHDVDVLQPKRDARSRAGWRFQPATCHDCRKAIGRKTANARHARRREKANEVYGPGCQCCGEQQLVFLAVDHKGGSGNAHRRMIGATGSATMYRWLEAQGWPVGFQMLCHNCNYAKHALGECPHARA